MKYTTFRNSLVAGGILAVAGGVFFVARPAHVNPAATAVSPSMVPSANADKAAPPVSALPQAAETADRPAARGLAAPTPATEPADKAAPRVKTPLREMDRELLKLYTQTRTGGAKAAKNKDVFPNRPYKVNLYVEGDQIRIKVDLNRNGKWDEKWSFEPGSEPPVVKRQVSPADDDTTYTLVYKSAGDTWVQK